MQQKIYNIFNKINQTYKLFNTSAIKLITKPVIGTPLGDLEYPDEITVVDQKFN